MSDVNDETQLSTRKPQAADGVDETVLSSRKPAAEVVDETVLSSRTPIASELADETVLSPRSRVASVSDETVLSTRQAASEPTVDDTVLSTRAPGEPSAGEQTLLRPGLPRKSSAAPAASSVSASEEESTFVASREVLDASDAASVDKTFGPRDLPRSDIERTTFEQPVVTKVGKSANELWELNKKRARRRSTRLVLSLVVSGIAIVALVIVGVAIFAGQS